MFFIGCAPTKSLLKEQLSQQTKTTTGYKEQLSQSKNRASQLQIEKDITSEIVLFWMGRYESERMEKVNLQQQFEANKWKIEYYESGQVKSEEKSTASKSTEISSEIYERTISELQSKLEQEIKSNEQLQADSAANSQLLIDKDIKIKELTDTNTKLQSKEINRGFFWWVGFVASILIVGFVIFWIAKVFIGKR